MTFPGELLRRQRTPLTLDRLLLDPAAHLTVGPSPPSRIIQAAIRRSEHMGAAITQATLTGQVIAELYVDQTGIATNTTAVPDRPQHIRLDQPGRRAVDDLPVRPRGHGRDQ